MIKLNLKKPIAFFDIESTGINVASDRIVEISILKINTDGTEEVKTKRINPEMPIPIESSLIHGIYDEDIKDEPTFKQIAKGLAQFLDNCDLGGYNSKHKYLSTMPKLTTLSYLCQFCELHFVI